MDREIWKDRQSSLCDFAPPLLPHFLNPSPFTPFHVLIRQIWLARFVKWSLNRSFIILKSYLSPFVSFSKGLHSQNTPIWKLSGSFKWCHQLKKKGKILRTTFSSIYIQQLHKSLDQINKFQINIKDISRFTYFLLRFILISFQ